MIDPCIYKVYKQDLKVFIPDFGAIIYSEATDSIDFNDLLTFDDGKVIEEIKSRKKTSKKVAEKALKEHIDDLKEKLDAGKSHLIRGLGYLYKNEEGSYAIQKKKPVLLAKGEKAEEGSLEEENTSLPQIDSAENNAKEDVASESDPPFIEDFAPDDIEPDLIIGQELEEEEYADSTKDREALLGNEEQSYAYKPILSAEDEDVQEYYKRKDDYESEDKKRSPLFFIVAATVIILLLASAALYYFKFYSSDKTSFIENISMVSANTSNPEDDQTENNASNESNSSNEKLQKANSGSGSIEEEQNNSNVLNEAIASSSGSLDPTQQDKIYSLILGSFKVEGNANNFHAHLIGQGKDVSIFRRTGSFHFVGYEQIAGKSNALKLLEATRAEEEPTAWIIRKKQF